jgi:pantetheine-phosphate adenylyltransferase
MAEVFGHLNNVRATTHTNLVVNLALDEDVDFIIKGLRAVSDFESELQMAQLNKEISGVETMFMPSASASSFIASKYVRDIASFGGDVSMMVPGPVLSRLRAKLDDSD